jgi:hypothetical protein
MFQQSERGQSDFPLGHGKEAQPTGPVDRPRWISINGSPARSNTVGCFHCENGNTVEQVHHHDLSLRVL